MRRMALLALAGTIGFVVATDAEAAVRRNGAKVAGSTQRLNGPSLTGTESVSLRNGSPSSTFGLTQASRGDVRQLFEEMIKNGG